MGVDYRIFQPSVGLRLFQAGRVGFQINEFQRVSGDQIGIGYVVLVIVEKLC